MRITERRRRRKRNRERENPTRDIRRHILKQYTPSFEKKNSKKKEKIKRSERER